MNARVPELIQPNGRPLREIIGRQPVQRAGLSGDWQNAFSYDASNLYSNETEGWYPVNHSPDYDYNIHRDRVVARARDLVRNDGWAAGAIIRMLDSAIGSHYLLNATPSFETLQRWNPKFDEVWADEFAEATESLFDLWADDPAHYCDATRQLSFTQMMRLAMRHRAIDGEDLVNLDWMPERVGYGGAHYATCVRLIDPDRLSNPREQIDTLLRRGGVELDSDGVPLGYHIRCAHQNDWYGTIESMEWDFFEREYEGRPIILHDFDRERVDQNRGVSIFVPVMNRLKMIIKADQVELQAAVLNSILSIAVTSPYDPEGLREAATSSETGDATEWYWSQLKADRAANPIRMAQASVQTFRPGEKAEAINTSRPGPQHNEYTDYGLRHVASGIGTQAEQITQNWSNMNYSNARSAIMDARKTVSRRQGDFATGTATPIYAAWLEEAMDRRELPMPKSGTVVDFQEARAAFSKCGWIGPPAGWVDQVKEAQGAVLRMDAAISTLREECAAQGKRYRRNIKQRGIERRMFDKEKLPHPTWMGEDLGGGQDPDATQVTKKPLAA